METVDAHPKLRAALSDLLGPIYRRSTRNEIRVGAASPEHTDTLEWCSHGTSGYPSARVGRYPFPTELTGMGRNGSDYAIVTVAIYLQVSIRRARAFSSRSSFTLCLLDYSLACRPAPIHGPCCLEAGPPRERPLVAHSPALPPPHATALQSHPHAPSIAGTPPLDW